MNNTTATNGTDSLITLDEAEEVIQIHSSPLSNFRLFGIIAVVLIVVVSSILLTMIFVESRGKNTGLNSLFPFFNQEQVEGLEL